MISVANKLLLEFAIESGENSILESPIEGRQVLLEVSSVEIGKAVANYVEARG